MRSAEENMQTLANINIDIGSDAKRMHVGLHVGYALFKMINKLKFDWKGKSAKSIVAN